MVTLQGRTTAATLAAATLLLAACGGGGSGSTGTGSGSGGSGGPPADPVWSAGHYQTPATYAAYCAVPRSGSDPVSGARYPDRQGSIVWENAWIRAWSQAYYLWYSELPDLDPAAYATTDAYFKLMKTPAMTAAGTSKDRFHFTYPSSKWESFATAGVQLGYGVTWAFVALKTPRKLLVAYTDPATPASIANLMRGESVLQIDGIDLVNANDTASVNQLNGALSPTRAGESHSFLLQDVNGGLHNVTMAAASVTSTPVQHVQTLAAGGGLIGYFAFNDHIGSAEAELVAAIQTLAAAGVTDLILDLRYNGGGLLDIASEVAFMIAGPARTTGRTFEQLAFNAKYPSTDPITGAALQPTPFYATARGFSVTAGTALPTLNLGRVIVLTGNDTCSASESIINSLNGIGVMVVQIGAQTCGKPYGFYPQDNCGTTYFSIQFKGVNAVAFGDYADGFVPANALTPNGGVPLPGCSVADDFSHALGDAAESRLAAALNFAQSGTCPSPTGVGPLPTPLSIEGHVAKPVWLMNRIVHR